MGKKRKERTVAELYKRTAKLSKPRITPILEGHCRIQGPLNESDSECETKTLCNTADRNKEKDCSSEHMECSVSTNVSKRRRNKEQDNSIELDHNTGDMLLRQRKTTGKESLSEDATGKSASKDFVEREEMSGSKKTRISSNVRRSKGNKSRKGGVASSHSDCGQKVEVQATSTTELSEKSLETPSCSQRQDEENILFLGKQPEETCDQSRNSGTSSSHPDNVQKAETQATGMIEQSEKPIETLDASQLRDGEKMLYIDKQSEETCDKSKNAAICNSDSDYEQKAEILEGDTIEQNENSMEAPFASQSNEETILSLGKKSEETCYISGCDVQNEVQATCTIDQIEKALETPTASQSNDEMNIPSLEKQFQETHDKCFDKELADVLQSNETSIVAEAGANGDDKGIKKQEEADEELPVTKASDASDISPGDSHSVGIILSKNSLSTCNMAPLTVSDKINESRGSPGIQLPMPLHSNIDVHVPGSENSSEMLQIHFNGNACINKDLPERPVIGNSSRLENADEQTSTSSKSLVTENVFLKGSNVSSDMTNAKNTTSLELPGTHFEKTSSSLMEDSLDGIQKIETGAKGSEFFQQNNNNRTVTSTNSNVEDINTFAENSFLGHSLSGDVTEPVNSSFKSDPSDHSLFSSPKKKEFSNIFSEDNISQEAVSSSPLSAIPGHSYLTSASQSVETEKEIEAYTSKQQEEDFAFMSSTVCTEFSTNKNNIIDAEEAKDVLPVLTVAARSPEHLENDVLKRNMLDQDFHFCEASKKLVPSELAISSGVSLPCREIEKSCEPLSGGDDVKVCDICGNTGYEGMLAVCSVCNNGAEHIYCMQTMLDEVPERDWLCEDCKLKQDINVKKVETSTSSVVISKPTCLNSRKHNSYGTARSRLSAKLDKKKFIPERKRAFKGIPSSLLSTKRQAESEIGPATKKLAVGTPSSNIGSLSSNPKSYFYRENSFKALDIGTVKTSIAVSSTGDLPISSVHDSGKSSTLYGASSPRLPTSVQLSKNRLLSLNSRMNDSSVVTGSKAGRNAPSTHTVKVSTDSSAPLRSNSFNKLSVFPKDAKESIEVGVQFKTDRENTSNSHASGGIAKPLKCNTNIDLSTVSDPKTSSGVQNLETKEIRTGKLVKDGLGLAKKKGMSKSLSLCRNSKSGGAINLEKPAVDDRHAKSVTFLMKDSPNSKPVRSEVKMAVAPRQFMLNSNKEHNSLRFSADGREGRTQLKTSPSKFQGGVAVNKLQLSASTEVSHKVTAEKSEDKSLFETTFVIKSTEEENLFPSVKDEKMSNSLGEKLAAEGRASQNEKKGATLANKPISNDLLPEENKKTGNFKKSSLKWLSPNHRTAAGSTRCYKCKELGHSAQLCTSHSFAETGSSGLRVSSLIASAARTAKDLSDNVSVKLNTLEGITSSGNYKAGGNDESSVQRPLLFNSEQDHAEQSGSGSPGQVSSNKEASNHDPNCNSVESSKGTTYLSKELDIKIIESCQVSIPTRDSGQGLTTTTSILTSSLGEPSLVNPSSSSSKSPGEDILHSVANEKNKSGNDEILKKSSRKVQTVFPTEDVVVSIREGPSHGFPASLDGAGQPGIECRFVPCGVSSAVETTSATSLPEHNFLWQGGFDVQSNTNDTNYFDGIQAHASTSAASKVLDAVKKFPSKLKLEEVPRYSSWPQQFGHYRPGDKDIALYFFAKDHESYGRPYRKLLEHMLNKDLALRGNCDGAELLVFSSNQLAEQSQRWNRLLFLWGVFRERKSTCIETSTCMNESIQGELAKGEPSGSSHLNVNGSRVARLSSSLFGSFELEEMDTDRVVDGDSNATEGTLRVTGAQILVSTSSQDEGPNGNLYDSNIPNSPDDEYTKFNSTLKIDKKDTEQLSIKKHLMGSSFESNEQPSSKIPQSNRLSSPDLSAGLEISTMQMLQNARDGNFFEEKIPPEAGLVASGKFGEMSSSHIIQTERTKPNSLRHTPSASSTITLRSTERKAYSCDTFSTPCIQSDSLCQQTSVDKGRKRPRDAKCGRQMETAKEVESARLSSRDGEMDQGWRPWEKYRENSVVANERETDKSPSITREEDYSNCEPKYQKDRMQHRKRLCPSRSHSPPQIGFQSHSPTKKIFNNDFEYSQTHSPNWDHVKQPLRWQAPEMVPEFDGSSHEKLKNIAVDGKQGRRKLKKSYNDVEGQENGKKQDVGDLNLAEQKMSSRQSYPIADLNQAADFESAVEFSGTSVQQHIQQEDPVGHLHLPQYCQLTERVFFPFSDDMRRNHRLSNKQSEQWPSQFGSKQSSSESSSTSRLISSTEEKWERLDLNMPNLELDLGGRACSNPIRNSPVQGSENGSSLSLSLAYPLTQNDQTTNTQKEDYKKPVNYNVNASFCLFGHRVNG